MLDLHSNQTPADNDNDVEDKGKQKITPELVQAVTDRVYQLLLKEMRIENERRHDGLRFYR